ncbi:MULTISPECIES: permease prefix domain 1-containing protein [Thalassotalea]|uniref:Permease prefix domain 1-containing protein n=1 Tax=Thalassotalea castellviae TaxID=3075612 RepID=A0ABU3A3C2_9GAMM|nr:permease prefix domain 1-containing protein [Thalassotalea sp. W431]MDT0604675.1 permease prefix domain 1-containing protein [Thalassotalea sp. W431]
MSSNHFDLSKAVQQWCELVLCHDSIKSKNIEELKDHLYCQIESFQAQGQDDKTAFKLAIAKMGEVETLSNEYEKNRTFFQKLSAFEYGTVGDHARETMSIKSAVIQQSILWAAAIIGTSIMIEEKEQAMSLIFIVLIPLSVANIISLKTDSFAKECRYIKSKISQWFS